MKKAIRVMGVVFAAVLACCPAACKDKNDDGTFGGVGGKTTVRYYSFNDAASNAALRSAIDADFSVKYPDIKIQLEVSPESFYTNLLNDFVGGNEADVFGMEPGEIYPFLQQGYLEPLDGYFENSESVSLGDIWEINRRAYAFDRESKTWGTGKTYAVLKDWSTDTMLLYNRKLFSEEQLALIERDEDGDGVNDPLTFAQFEELCTQLLKKSGNTITQYSFLPGLAEGKVLAQFLANAGLSWYDPASYEPRFDDPAVREVVDYFYGILRMNEVNYTGSVFYPQFAQGNVAMVMGGLYCIENFGLQNLDLGVAYPPVKDDSCPCKPFTTGCVGFAVSSRSRKKDAAFKFIEWYLGYYGERDAKRCNNFPAIRSMAETYMLDPAYNTEKTKFDATKAFYASLEKAVVIDRNLYCSQASFESLEFTYAGEFIDGSMSLADFCSVLQSGVAARVRQAKLQER